MRWKDLDGGENGENINTRGETWAGQCKIWECDQREWLLRRPKLVKR